jgi:hypothetical protein
LESGVPLPPPRRSRPSFLVLVLVAALAGAAAFVFLRRLPGSTASKAVGAPSPEALLPSSPVLLSAKATIIADRYHCLCGDCSDTLGRCTCARDKGSNEMKSTLNKLAEEKKDLREIDAAMAIKYGPKVLVQGVPPAPASTPAK